MAHKNIPDVNRRELIFRDRRISEILPDYFPSTYPKLTALFEYYYEFLLENNASTQLLDHLYQTRDITTLDDTLLTFLEDELLLGQAYFEGFQDKRSAAKFSNTLYRSKGSKYSIQQFFRMFFGIDPEIRYTKEDVFTLGSSKIGPNDGKFLTDDELYQTYAILVKTGLPISKWKDIYKLFVHPAGFYLGAQVSILGEGFFGNQTPPIGLKQMPDPGTAEVPIPIYEGLADLGMMSATSFIGDNSYAEIDSTYTNGIGAIRYDINRSSIRTFGSSTLYLLDKSYPSLLKMIDGYVIADTTSISYPGVTHGFDATADSAWQISYPTFDNDSASSNEQFGGRFDFSLDSGLGLFGKESLVLFSDN